METIGIGNQDSPGTKIITMPMLREHKDVERHESGNRSRLR